MSPQKLIGCGVLAAVLLPLSAALFVVVSVLSFIQSLPSSGIGGVPGGDLALAAMDHFAGRAGGTPTASWPDSKGTAGGGWVALRAYQGDIKTASARFGVDRRLIGAVILQESGGDPNATSPVGAAGLMQLMPATFAGLGYDPARIYEPGLNIAAGARYLSDALTAFDGDAYWAAAGYNAGIAAAGQLKEQYGYVPASFAGGETRRYVDGVLAAMGEE